MTLQDINNVPKHAGIYCIKNTVNGKCYVGQAIKLRQRLRNHWYTYESNRLEHIVIYKALHKYGADNFELIILKTFSDALSADTKKQLDFWEKHYIQEYDSYNNGYNSTLGGDAGVLGYKMTDEQIEKIRQASLLQQENIRIQQAENPDNWIKCRNVQTEEVLIFKTKKEASEALLIKSYTITRCLAKTYHIANKIYQFCRYNEEFEQIPKYGTDAFDEWSSGHFKKLSNKDEICDYIKNNPTCSYAEVKQLFDLSRKTFYNYRNELDIKFDQRIDTKVTKEDFQSTITKGIPKKKLCFISI